MAFCGNTFGLGEAGFRRAAMVVISFMSLSATVSMNAGKMGQVPNGYKGLTVRSDIVSISLAADFLC